MTALLLLLACSSGKVGVSDQDTLQPTVDDSGVEETNTETGDSADSADSG